MRVVAVTIWMGLAAGCAPPEAFQCASAAACDRGSDGRCEANGACSYAAADCESGRRYGEHAGGLSGSCVDDSVPQDGAIDDATDAPDAPDAPIVDSPPTTDGLLGYWPLDVDGTDASGRGNTAMLVASPTLTTGHLGMGYQFDGTNFLHVPSLDDAAFPATGTLSFWVSSSFAPAEAGTFDYHAPTRTHLFVRTITGPKLQVACQLSTQAPYAAFIELPVAAGWHHVAVTWDAADPVDPRLRMYFDGVLRGNDDITQGWAPTQQRVSLMQYLPGILDEVRLYDRVLTLAEIQALP